MVLASPVWAADYQVMIDRDPDAVELFIRIPARLLPEKFAPFPDGFVTAQDQVDIAPFRAGTWEHGDAFFADVTASVAGEPVIFEAMSMMVHPPEFDVPFRDPIDAFTAIGVCNVPEGLSLFSVDSLMAYMGYIAYPVDGYADLTVLFPASASIEVSEFDQGRPIGNSRVSVGPDEPMVLPRVTPKRSWFDWLFH